MVATFVWFTSAAKMSFLNKLFEKKEVKKEAGNDDDDIDVPITPVRQARRFWMARMVLQCRWHRCI